MTDQGEPLVIETPAQARVIIDLPPIAACAYSPGFRLHVYGRGETLTEAKYDLISNLREIGERIYRKAHELEDSA